MHGIPLLWVPSAYLEMISKFEMVRRIRSYFSSGLNFQSLEEMTFRTYLTAELLDFSVSIVGKLTQHISEKGNTLEPGVIF